MRLYLDANALIHGIEGPQPLRKAVLEWIDRAESEVDGLAVTSRLTRLECRVKPLKDGNQALLNRIESVLESGAIEVVPISDEVIESATQIRADFGMRTPDAIHLATAVLHRADVVLTRDRRLRKFDRIRIELLSPAE